MILELFDISQFYSDLERSRNPRANTVGLTGPRLMNPFLSATRSATCRSAGCRILTRNVLVKTSAVVVPARTKSPITASSSIVTRGGRRGITSRYSYSAFAGSGILDARGTRLLEVRNGTTIFVVAEAVEAAVVAAAMTMSEAVEEAAMAVAVSS